VSNIQEISLKLQESSTYDFLLRQYSTNHFECQYVHNNDIHFDKTIICKLLKDSKGETAYNSFKNLVQSFSKIISEYDSIIEVVNSCDTFLLSKSDQQIIMGNSVKIN
jgi:hypothetical protein